MGVTNKNPYGYREKAEIPFYADNSPYRTPASPDPEPKKPFLSREAKSSILAILVMIIAPLLACIIGYCIGRVYYLVSQNTLPSDAGIIIFCGLCVVFFAAVILFILALIFSVAYGIIDNHLNEKR